MPSTVQQRLIVRVESRHFDMEPSSIMLALRMTDRIHGIVLSEMALTSYGPASVWQRLIVR